MTALLAYLIMIAIIIGWAVLLYFALDLEQPAAGFLATLAQFIGFRRCPEMHDELGVQCERVQGHEPVHRAAVWSWR